MWILSQLLRMGGSDHLNINRRVPLPTTTFIKPSSSLHGVLRGLWPYMWLGIGHLIADHLRWCDGKIRIAG